MTLFAYLLREADGSVRTFDDRHVEGIFPTLEAALNFFRRAVAFFRRAVAAATPFEAIGIGSFGPVEDGRAGRHRVPVRCSR